MKKLLLIAMAIFLAMNLHSQVSCGDVLNDTFDDAGTLPDGWTEYNTSGSVTVESGYLKLNMVANNRPATYREFTPVTNGCTVSFDIKGSRTTMNCQVDLVDSVGNIIASIALGKGTTDIKYATSVGTYVAGVIGTAKFAKNTYYSLSMYVDFTDQTVDFYNAGVMTLEDIPFLQTASNLRKLDVQLLYMYANSGTSQLDNLVIVESSTSRKGLTDAVAAASETLNAATIGSGFQQYPQSAADTFQSVLDAATAVLNDCNAQETAIASAITDLEAERTLFLATGLNPLVLTFYSEYNFSGNETEMYCGYYNGGLGDLEDKPVSFKLDSGYMATFAQDINGLGFSKVYVAQDHDLELNLPAELQRSISFVRVSPWFPVAKKGSLGDVKWTDSESYNASWHYNWGLGDNSAAYTTPEVQFVPMSWSTGDGYTSISKMEAIGQNMALNHHMAFNEPDNSSQSNLSVATALAAYPKLLASGLRLGAPGVENVQYSAMNDSFSDGAWIQEFLDSCVARGYRVDFIPAHDYVRRSKSTFLERFEALYDRYGIPVWVTEYNYGNPNMGSADLTVEQGYTNVKSLTEGLENADFIERYNWYYFFGASSGIGGITDGELNITGEFYRDLESQNPSYSQEVYEEGDYIAPDLVTGLDNAEADNLGLALYPNPVSDGVLKVIFSDALQAEAASVRIYNVSGEEIMNQSISSQEVNVSHLESGFYIVKVQSGNKQLVQRVIINK